MFRPAMNLLLLLSALLSALTGVGAGARAPERAQAVAEARVGRTAVALVPAMRAQRPAAGVPRPVAVAMLGVDSPIAVVRAIPAWTSRRRE